jgi:hypothetical protein
VETEVFMNNTLANISIRHGGRRGKRRGQKRCRYVEEGGKQFYPTSQNGFAAQEHQQIVNVVSDNPFNDQPLRVKK